MKLSEHVGRGDRRFRTYFYNCPPYQSPQPTAEERTAKSRYDRFIGRVELLPCFEVRHGRLRWDRDHNRPEQKMVDILLAIDLVRLAARQIIDRAVLVTNDSDFVPAIRVAKEEGVIVELYRHPDDRNYDLERTCDTCFAIDQPLIDAVRLP